MFSILENRLLNWVIALSLAICLSHNVDRSCAAPSPASQNGSHLPAEFIDEPFSTNWKSPTAFAFDPEGNTYIAERSGRVWKIDAKSQKPGDAPFLDLSKEVATSGDLGLLGIALDPDFLYNGYFYASYAVAPVSLFGDKAKESDPTQLRVVRYSADPKEDFSKVTPGSRRILLGDQPGTGPAILAGANPGGALAFGSDGSLLVGTGDGASPRSADAGAEPESATHRGIEPGLIREKENIGAFRSQLVDSLSGKILRLNPETGAGLPTNPYFDPQDPKSPRSLVWSLGLRNPFRLAVVPKSGGRYLTDGDPGTLFIGDVGWGTAEEINVAKEGARNFGWPLFEGLVAQNAFIRLDVKNPDAVDSDIGPDPIAFRHLIRQATEDPNPVFPHPTGYGKAISAAFTYVHRRPVLEYRDGARVGLTSGNETSEIVLGSDQSPVSGTFARGSCSIAGTWFDGVGYPATFRGSYFHADLRGGWIQQLLFDQNGDLSAVAPFLSSRRQIIQVAVHPTEGILYYLDHAAGELRRIRFTGDVNLPPVAQVTQSSLFGPSPLTVNFDASPSSDPEGAALAYHWDFGDGQTSNESIPTHVFVAEDGVPKAFPVTLTITDPKGLTSVRSLTVSANNTPPRVRITSIRHGDLYEENAESTEPAAIPLRAEVEDAEHDSSALTYRWQTVLHHNKHTHELPPKSDPTSQAILPTTPCGFDAYAYRIELTVTDAAGLSTTVQTWLYPNCQCLNRATAEVWRLGHFESGELTSKGIWNADPDSDGLTNLLEYALGRQPKDAESAGPILTVAGIDSPLSISYDRPEWQPDLTYSLEISKNGETWFTVEEKGDQHLPTIHPTDIKGVEHVAYSTFDRLLVPGSEGWARLRILLSKTGDTAVSPPVSVIIPRSSP